MKKLINVFVMAVLAITVCSALNSCGKSQEWYDKNQNFSDIEGTWYYETNVEGAPQTMRLIINEDGTGNMMIMVKGRTIIDDDVKLGRSKENLSILFSTLDQANLYIKDGKVYSNDWEPFEKR